MEIMTPYDKIPRSAAAGFFISPLVKGDKGGCLQRDSLLGESPGVSNLFTDVRKTADPKSGKV
jgi:hypothetical protein